MAPPADVETVLRLLERGATRLTLVSAGKSLRTHNSKAQQALLLPTEFPAALPCCVLLGYEGADSGLGVRGDFVSARTCLTIVLAAGEGTRMRSRHPKVMHAIGGRSLLAHVLAAVASAGTTATAVVIGTGQEDAAAEVKRIVPDADVFIQAERRGTAHAALCAREALGRGADDVLVVFGDTPFVPAATLAKLRDAIAGGAAVAVLGFRPADPTGYGRLIMQGDRLTDIREHKDANEAERAIGFCNGGVMAFDGRTALRILDRVDDRNAPREFYLTDAVKIANALGLSAAALETEEDDVRGINTRAQLAEAETVLQKRLRAAALEAGVTMVAPDTVFLSADTKLGRDVVIEPHVVFGPGVVVEDEAVIHSFSHLEGAHVGKGASVGPFARLRRGTRLGPKVRIGNFVEVKAGRDRGRSQGQPPRLYRRRPGGRGRQHRGRHHLLQLRRRAEAPHRDRQQRVHRLEQRAGGAGHDRRRCLRGDRIGGHRGRACGRARHCPLPAGH